MTKKNIIPLSLFPIIFLLIFYASLPLVMAEEKLQGNWEYSIQNNFEYSKRSYLLVYRPQTAQERRINVISQCRKPYPAEGTYGACTHVLDIQPTKTNFTLPTGEDVVLIDAARDASLILGTLEYGCCADPDAVRFYTENGNYLGRIKGRLRTRFNSDNMITRIFDAGNSTGYNDKPAYFAVETEGRDTRFQAIVLDDTAKMVRIPILFTIADREDCGEWYLSQFIKYGDRKDLTLKVSGFFCKNKEGTRQEVYSCSVSEKAITCMTSKRK